MKKKQKGKEKRGYEGKGHVKNHWCHSFFTCEKPTSVS